MTPDPKATVKKETASRLRDTKSLMSMTKDELVDLLFTQMRILWTVDGLYYLGIEERFGTQAATDIDAKTWHVLGKIECRKLRETTGFKGDDMDTFEKLLMLTSWALDLEDKEFDRKGDVLVLRNTKCRVQNTRISKGLTEFGCKVVRLGYLVEFAKEFSPKYSVTCKVCPPDKHPGDLWCEWVFTRMA
jgi:hypothetical protein